MNSFYSWSCFLWDCCTLRRQNLKRNNFQNNSHKAFSTEDHASLSLSLLWVNTMDVLVWPSLHSDKGNSSWATGDLDLSDSHYNLKFSPTSNTLSQVTEHPVSCQGSKSWKYPWRNQEHDPNRWSPVVSFSFSVTLTRERLIHLKAHCSQSPR